jgi:hypothetical protein
LTPAIAWAKAGRLSTLILWCPPEDDHEKTWRCSRGMMLVYNTASLRDDPAIDRPASRVIRCCYDRGHEAAVRVHCAHFKFLPAFTRLFCLQRLCLYILAAPRPASTGRGAPDCRWLASLELAILAA